MRLDALKALTGLGTKIDEQRNWQSAKGPRRISTDSSPIAVLVVPTNEELAIARDCLHAVSAGFHWAVNSALRLSTTRLVQSSGNVAVICTGSSGIMPKRLGCDQFDASD